MSFVVFKTDCIMKFSALTVAVVATVAATTVSAQTYTVKVGGAYIVPNASSSDFTGQLPVSGAPTLAGVNLEVQSKATLMFSVERAINDNFGVELVLGLPPKHDVKLKVSNAVRAQAGSDPRAALFTAYADKTIAQVKQMAPTLFFNYKFRSASDALRPYLGLGINYTKLDSTLNATGRDLYAHAGASSVKLHLDSSIAPALQAGVTYKVDKTWSVNVGVVSTFVNSTLDVTAGGYTHTAKFDFTPAVYTASVGYSF